MENRAAVFTSKPQAVEVYQAGAWWSGELLGWRHAADGTCQVWVRVVLGGVEETAWTGLDTLRLPERHLAMAPEPAAAGAVERELSVARHPSSRRDHRSGPESTVATTANLPRVRDLSLVSEETVAPAGRRRRAPDVPVAVPTGGRRRAPEEPAASSSGGRRRAPEEPAGAPSGGRRRAPETAVVSPAGGRRRAPEDPAPTSTGGRRRAPEGATATGPGALLGRHSVPASPGTSGRPGRHRTADTGLFPVASDEPARLTDTRRSVGAASGRGPAKPSARPAEPGKVTGSDAVAGWSAPSGLESELLTRPMRLDDHRATSRPRPDSGRRKL